jgi:hypothetical protein
MLTMVESARSTTSNQRRDNKRRYTWTSAKRTLSGGICFGDGWLAAACLRPCLQREGHHMGDVPMCLVLSYTLPGWSHETELIQMDGMDSECLYVFEPTRRRASLRRSLPSSVLSSQPVPRS